MKKITYSIMFAVAGMLGLTLLATSMQAEACSGAQCVVNSAKGSNTGVSSVPGVFDNIATTLLFVIGAVAVIMIIVAGFKYVTSNGNPQAVESAKSTILYSVIGIVVAILAYAIVRFIVRALT